jgi:hypothetical protein
MIAYVVTKPQPQAVFLSTVVAWDGISQRVLAAE